MGQFPYLLYYIADEHLGSIPYIVQNMTIIMQSYH
jgi:hypothetical protein